MKTKEHKMKRGIRHNTIQDFRDMAEGSVGTDRVVINVGGAKHECYISTIQNFPDTRLYWIAETALKTADFDVETNEFFFDRHPGCFENILNYCRTGKLHCPNDVCGPLFEQELAFWGVDEMQMEPCCWSVYTQHRDAHHNLKMFDDQDLSDDEEQASNSHEDHTVSLSHTAKMVARARKTVWAALEKPFSSSYAQIIALISMLVIIMSLTTFCMQTVPYFFQYKPLFNRLEYIYCGVFTVEFLVRLSCCPSWKKFFSSVQTYIDLVSTLQFYIAFFVKEETFDFLFVSRLIRIFRLFRFFKQLSGMQVIAQTLKASMNELMLLCLLVTIPMVIFSTLIHYAEEKENEALAKKSIPEYFWWAIITMTTVGYGDMYPRSGYAKIIGVMCACSGVLIVALPVSVIGSNFTLFYSYAQARMKLPKRRSPALLAANKELVKNQENNNNPPPSPLTSTHSLHLHNGDTNSAPDNEISESLQGPTSVIIDMAVPTARERRHAIQPALTLRPRSMKKSPSKQSNVAVDDAEETAEVDNIDLSDDVKKDGRQSLNELDPPGNSMESMHVSMVNDTSKSSKNRTSSCCQVNGKNHDAGDATSNNNNGNYFQTAFDKMRRRKKRTIHVDLTSYVPRRVSKQQILQRRKKSEVKQIHNTAKLSLQHQPAPPEEQIAPISEDHHQIHNASTITTILRKFSGVKRA